MRLQTLSCLPGNVPEATLLHAYHLHERFY